MTQQTDGDLSTGPSNISGPLRIDVVSDVVCPWCYLGKKRLEEALAALPDVHAEVFWRPFQLDGTIPKGGISREEYLTKKFGPNRNRDNYVRLEGIGKEAGIDFNFDAIKVSPNTLDAHRVLRWAQAVGTQSSVKERLFELYFKEGEDIGDPSVLAAVAAANGVEAEVVDRLLASDTDEDAVKEEIETAQRMGIQGVPFFIFNSRIALSGAQPADVIVQAIQQAMQQDSQPGEADNDN
jgi:predicted DsbA family dithiol-disulfide isomerase